MPVRELTITEIDPKINMDRLRLFCIGIAISLVDVRILGFNILPDSLGYVLTAWALFRMSAYQPLFRLSCVASAALALLALPDVYKSAVHTIDVIIEISYDSLLRGGISTVLSIFHTIIFTIALERMATEYKCSDLQQACKITRILYPIARLSFLLMPLVHFLLLDIPMLGAIVVATLIAFGFLGDILLFALSFKSFYIPISRRKNNSM